MFKFTKTYSFLRSLTLLLALAGTSSVMAQNHYFNVRSEILPDKDDGAGQEDFVVPYRAGRPAKVGYDFSGRSYTTDDDGYEIMGYYKIRENLYDITGKVKTATGDRIASVTYSNNGFPVQLYFDPSVIDPSEIGTLRKNMKITSTPSFFGEGFIRMVYTVTNLNRTKVRAKFGIGADTMVDGNDQSTNKQYDDKNIIQMKNEKANSGISFVSFFTPISGCHLACTQYSVYCDWRNGGDPALVPVDPRPGDSAFVTWWDYEWKPGETKTFTMMLCIGDDETVAAFLGTLAGGLEKDYTVLEQTPGQGGAADHVNATANFVQGYGAKLVNGCNTPEDQLLPQIADSLAQYWIWAESHAKPYDEILDSKASTLHEYFTTRKDTSEFQHQSVAYAQIKFMMVENADGAVVEEIDELSNPVDIRFTIPDSMRLCNGEVVHNRRYYLNYVDERTGEVTTTCINDMASWNEEEGTFVLSIGKRFTFAFMYEHAVEHVDELPASDDASGVPAHYECICEGEYLGTPTKPRKASCTMFWDAEATDVITSLPVDPITLIDDHTYITVKYQDPVFLDTQYKYLCTERVKKFYVDMINNQPTLIVTYLNETRNDTREDFLLGIKNIYGIKTFTGKEIKDGATIASNTLAANANSIVLDNGEKTKTTFFIKTDETNPFPVFSVAGDNRDSLNVNGFEDYGYICKTIKSLNFAKAQVAVVDTTGTYQYMSTPAVHFDNKSIAPAVVRVPGVIGLADDLTANTNLPFSTLYMCEDSTIVESIINVGTYTVLAYSQGIGSEEAPVEIGKFHIRKALVSADKEDTKDYLEYTLSPKEGLHAYTDSVTASVTDIPEGATAWSVKDVTFDGILPTQSLSLLKNYITTKLDFENKTAKVIVNDPLLPNNLTSVKVKIHVTESDNYDEYDLVLEIPLMPVEADVMAKKEDAWMSKPDVRYPNTTVINLTADKNSPVKNDMAAYCAQNLVDFVGGDDLAKNKGAWVWMEFLANDSVNALLPAAHKTALTTLAEETNYGVTALAEMKFFKQVPLENKIAIDRVDSIDVTLTIPDSLVSNRKSKFIIATIDETGKAKFVDTDYNPNTQTLRFTAEATSTYAIFTDSYADFVDHELNAGDTYLAVNYNAVAPKGLNRTFIIEDGKVDEMSVTVDGDGTQLLTVTYFNDPEDPSSTATFTVPLDSVGEIGMRNGQSLMSTNFGSSTLPESFTKNSLTITKGTYSETFIITQNGPKFKKVGGTTDTFEVLNGLADNDSVYATVSSQNMLRMEFDNIDPAKVLAVRSVGANDSIVYGGLAAFVTPEVYARNGFVVSEEINAIYKRLIIDNSVVPADTICQDVADNKPIEAGEYLVYAYAAGLGSETKPVLAGKFKIGKRYVSEEDSISAGYLALPDSIEEMQTQPTKQAFVQLSATPKGTAYNTANVSLAINGALPEGTTVDDFFEIAFDEKNNLIATCIRKGLKKRNDSLTVSVHVDESDNYFAYDISFVLPLQPGPDTNLDFYEDADIVEPDPEDPELAIVDATPIITNDLNVVVAEGDLDQIATEEEAAEGVWVWMEVKEVPEAEDVTNQEDVAILDQHAVDNGMELATYVEVNVYKQVPGEDRQEVTELETPATVTVTVPDEFRFDENDEMYPIRQFFLMNSHEGKPNKIFPKSFNKKTGELTFLASQFSTYAILYSDGEPYVADIKDKDLTIRFTGNKLIFASRYIKDMGANLTDEELIDGKWQAEGKDDVLVKSDIIGVKYFTFEYADYNLTDGDWTLVLPEGFFKYLNETYDFEGTEGDVTSDEEEPVVDARRLAKAFAEGKTESVQAIKFNVTVKNGVVTAINGVEALDADAVVYDLAGRKLNVRDAKGIVILNGKKVVK